MHSHVSFHIQIYNKMEYIVEIKIDGEIYVLTN